MKNNLFKLLTSNKQIRIFMVDAADVIKKSNLKYIETDFAKELYVKIITNCSLLRGLLADKGQRMTISFRFKPEGHSAHCEIDGSGNVNCIFSSKLSAFQGNLNDITAEGAVLSITRGSWMDGMFTGTVELKGESVDHFFDHFFSKSEQTETIFRSWTDNGIARGCMIPPLPFAEDSYLDKVVNDMFCNEIYFKAEDINSWPGLIFPYAKAVEKYSVQSECNCSKNMFFGMLMALETNEIKDSLKLKKGIELECGVCGKKYSFAQNDLEMIINMKERK